MKTILKLGTVFGAVTLLSACAGNYDVSGVSMMANKGDAFATALQKRYIERAEFEVNEGDWISVSFFNGRAKMAAMGDVPAPQMVADRRLKVDGDAISLASTSLSSALLTRAPQDAPDACARAQTWLEHWMEQAEEGHQPDDIATARSGFEKAMPDCTAQVASSMPVKKAMPMMEVVSVPDPVVVYFTFDSFDLSSANMDLIRRAAKEAMAARVKRVVLIGHADRSGSKTYNEGLSRARVIAVGNALMQAGVARKMVKKSFAGETSPQVGTKDGVRERMNRRVEMVFER